MNPSERVTGESQSGCVKTTSAVPAVWDGMVALISEAETTLTSSADEPPRVTFTPARKCSPRIVMVMPPVVGPLSGLIEVMPGALTK